MRKILTALALSAIMVAPAWADTAFTILGSNGGPIARMDRSQPANLLVVNGRVTLVDVGDGVAGRLAGKRLRMNQVDDVLISHLHFDHVGGLLAVLGLRFQTDAAKPLNIYGPPGTKILVDGLLAGMAPSMEAGYGLEDAPVVKSETLVQVTEVNGGDSFKIGDTTVSTVTNTHYGLEPGSDEAKHGSLSFRFNTPDRSIVYTGDTGWSDDVVTLSKDADLLVAELIDMPSMQAQMVRIVAPEALRGVMKHLSEHHITPTQIGQLASAAGVAKVVATHLVAGGPITPAETDAWVAQIVGSFNGEVVISQDLGDY